MYDFEGLSREIALEKNKVYVEPEAHLLLTTAVSSSEVNEKGLTHNYVSMDKFRDRI